jgi:hypothetical protein
MDHDREAVTHKSDEALQSQIVSARASLRHDLLLLEEKVTPSAIIDRRRQVMGRRIAEWRRMGRERIADLRAGTTSLQEEIGETMEETMAGTTERVADAMSTTRSRIRRTTSRATELPGRAAMSVRNSTYSRPLLFAGIALLAGWGMSRLLPMTRPEEELAQRVAPVVGEKAAPLVDEARSAVTESAREAIAHREI